MVFSVRNCSTIDGWSWEKCARPTEEDLTSFVSQKRGLTHTFLEGFTSGSQGIWINPQLFYYFAKIFEGYPDPSEYHMWALFRVGYGNTIVGTSSHCILPLARYLRYRTYIHMTSYIYHVAPRYVLVLQCIILPT